jgi:DNA-directed RNA polymerase subunit RPC12/RpoP
MTGKRFIGNIRYEVKKVKFECDRLEGDITMRCIKCNAKIEEFICFDGCFDSIKCEACGQEYLYKVVPPKVFPIRECKISLYTWRYLSKRKVGTWGMKRRKSK